MGAQLACGNKSDSARGAGDDDRAAREIRQVLRRPLLLAITSPLISRSLFNLTVRARRQNRSVGMVISW